MTNDAREYQIGGDHYVAKAFQPWDVMEEYMDPSEFRGFLWGCIIKYILRWKTKGGSQDLKKAQHFLERLIYAEDIKGKPVLKAAPSVSAVRGKKQTGKARKGRTGRVGG